MSNDNDGNGYWEIVAFSQRHGAVITTALRAYIEDARKTAAAFQAEYDKIRDNPIARAVQDQSLVTTDGLKYTAQNWRENAQRAEAALAAYTALVEDAEESCLSGQHAGITKRQRVQDKEN